ncbi:MAG TPA: hypothetical protein VFI05_07725 [Nitrospiraceae bacterium]|nr:hypothetical protein [Nitrospiraceae bacterium]
MAGTSRIIMIILFLNGMMTFGEPAAQPFAHELRVAQESGAYESVTESERLFDPEAVQTVRGVVMNIEDVTMEHVPFMQVTLKTNHDDTVSVHLAPQWFMREQIQRLELDIGREVEVRGSPQVVDGKPVLVAAEITNDRRDQRLRLRHQDGTPVWAGGERVS